MKFEFPPFAAGDIDAWIAGNRKLHQDLAELTAGNVSEEEVTAYVMDMCKALRPIVSGSHYRMLFLMYDEPASMPADDRVDFVYTPTYYAATILMTAMNRFDSIAFTGVLRKVTHEVLNAAMGREFRGAGYDRDTGLIETLQIFALGDTAAFLEKYPEFNHAFTHKFEEALDYLENEICTGKVKDTWSGADYRHLGEPVLAMYRSRG